MTDTTRLRLPATDRTLLLCGAVGAPLFVAVILVEGALRPGYDPFYQPGSALSLGDRGWIQIANFLITGLLLVAFSAGVSRALDRALVGPVLIGVLGVAVMASGAFTMDPMRGYPSGTPAGDPLTLSWQHHAHDFAGIVVFLSVPAACFVLARHLGGWWRAYTVVSGVAGLALFLWFGAAWEADAPNAGLVQRLAILTDWTWLTLLAVRLLRARPRPALP